MQFEEPKHYKHFSTGTITLIGNSCQIQENTSGLSEESLAGIELHKLNFDHRYFSKKKRPPTRKAGDITCFSKKSRLRMLKKANRVDHQNKTKPYFITLTYPKRYPTDKTEYKSDLDVFFKRLKRTFGELEYLWRLEAQKRGAPHYHILVYFDSKINGAALKQWVSKNWYEIAQRKWDVKDEKHLKAGTNCKRVKNYSQAAYYISKYMGKTEDDNLINQGRYWGSSKGWEDFIAEDKLEGKELIWFRRIMKRYLKRFNPYMADKVTTCRNIEIWVPKQFVINAYLWSKFVCDAD